MVHGICYIPLYTACIGHREELMSMKYIIDRFLLSYLPLCTASIYHTSIHHSHHSNTIIQYILYIVYIRLLKHQTYVQSIG